jgi:LuxR family maltose regulon positive regulatory protein
VPTPPLETKFFVPRLRRCLVARPLLSDQLARGAMSKWTLVSALAGFGKTTLLGEWLASRDKNAYWRRSRPWISGGQWPCRSGHLIEQHLDRPGGE